MSTLGRPNHSGVDWGDPAAVTAYNRRYQNDHYAPNGRAHADRDQASGEAHGSAKLTWPLVHWMRTRYAQGNISYVQLRQRVKTQHQIAISSSTVADVIRGHTWKEDG